MCVSYVSGDLRTRCVDDATTLPGAFVDWLARLQRKDTERERKNNYYYNNPAGNWVKLECKVHLLAGGWMDEINQERRTFGLNTMVRRATNDDDEDADRL